MLVSVCVCMRLCLCLFLCVNAINQRQRTASNNRETFLECCKSSEVVVVCFDDVIGGVMQVVDAVALLRLRVHLSAQQTGGDEAVAAAAGRRRPAGCCDIHPIETFVHVDGRTHQIACV